MRRLLVAAALGVVVVSCTTGGTSPTVADDVDSTVRDFVAEENAATRPPPTGDPSVSAVDVEELRSVLFGAGGADSDLTLHLRHEEILVDCMGDQGFEYVAMPYGGSLESPRFDASLDADEFARLYGLGLSTLVEVEDLASAVIAATSVDPNDSLRAAMSDAELVAYQEAFSGPPDLEANSEDGSYRPAEHGAGCNGKASAVYGGVESFDLSDEARDALLSVEQVVQADPGVRAAQDEWSACMGAAGYDVATPDDLVAIVDMWLSPVLATSATKTVTTTGPDGAAITVEIPDLDQEALTTGQRREIELALVDRTCDDASGLSEAMATAREIAQDRAISQWYGELSGSSSK